MTRVHMTIQNWTFNSLYIAYTIWLLNVSSL